MRFSSPSSSACFTHHSDQEDKRCLNSELWHACAGPLVSLPTAGSRVVYFPQGHSEQVAASTNKQIDAHIPNYPSLPPQLICILHNVTMHADVETDEVYSQMTLQPLSPQEQKDAFLPVDMGFPSNQPTNYFCKTLTASDTSTHGGFSVPRRAAEKVFPPLDFSQQPPAQELIARDLHDNEWKFRHIFRGQPKRHLLTTGWSVFVSAKRLVAGDSVLFIWNEKNQLLLGIRRANRPQTVMPSSVLSSDSMHIGLLAAAAHAATTNSRFTIFYNPRASPSEFVIPLTKYVKAVYHTRVSVGMRFRMLFETEESSVRRYMGTITGISDLDPARWPSSHWRSVKVGWDESTAGERQPRVSLWEIEPLTTFPMYSSPFSLRLKRPWPPGMPSLPVGNNVGMDMNSPLMWLPGDGADRGINFQGIGVAPWMQPRLDVSLLGLQPDMYQAMAAAAFQEMRTMDPCKQTSSSLQFQQLQDVPNLLSPQNAHNLSSFVQRQMLPQSQPQQSFLQCIQGDINPAQTQSHFLQQQLEQQNQCNDRQQQPQKQQQQEHSQVQSHVIQQQLQQQNQCNDREGQHQPPQKQQQQPYQFTSRQHQQHHHYQQQQQLQQQQQQQQHQHQQQQQQRPKQQQTQQQQQQQREHSHQFSSQQAFPSSPSISSLAPEAQSQSQSQSPSLMPIPSLHQPQNFSGSGENLVNQSTLSPLQSLLGSDSQEETGRLLNLHKINSVSPSAAWLPKLPSGAQCVLPQVEQLGPPQMDVSPHPTSLPPFPGKECSDDQDANTDTHNHLLFGSSALLMQNGMPSLRGFGSDSDSTTIPFAASSFHSTAGTDFQVNESNTTSRCLDESSFLHSPENVGQVIPPTRTFVKVHKSGSFGRSLDITRFSSYHELRSELACMFGLEGQLEDPLRSGWQLVFVDRENDILLLGDDPWQEFVNSVWCIKILSPEEVQEMGKHGFELLNRVSSGICDNYMSQQDSRNLNNGIISVGSLEY